jgi:hypothetical protein
MKVNMATVMDSLKLMGMGMLAIFIVIIVIYAAVSIMLNVTADKE